MLDGFLTEQLWPCIRCSCSHAFLHGLYGAHKFLTAATYEVGYLFLSQKEWYSTILWSVLYLLWRENLQPSIVWVIFSAASRLVGSTYAFFQRYHNCFYRILAAIRSFKSTVHFPNVKTCRHPVLPARFLSAYFRTPVTIKQTSYRNGYIFRATSIILKWEQLLETANFSQKDFFQNTWLSGAATSF